MLIEREEGKEGEKGEGLVPTEIYIRTEDMLTTRYPILTAEQKEDVDTPRNILVVHYIYIYYYYNGDINEGKMNRIFSDEGKEPA